MARWRYRAGFMRPKRSKMADWTEVKVVGTVRSWISSPTRSRCVTRVRDVNASISTGVVIGR